jgi:hypothetical protein
MLSRTCSCNERSLEDESDIHKSNTYAIHGTALCVIRVYK